MFRPGLRIRHGSPMAGSKSSRKAGVVPRTGKPRNESPSWVGIVQAHGIDEAISVTFDSGSGARGGFA